MTDPAISAARKVFTEYWPDQGDFEFNYSSEGRFGIEVAREMAKSIQTVIEEWDSKGELHPQVNELLDQLAPLVYPSGELGL